MFVQGAKLKLGKIIIPFEHWDGGWEIRKKTIVSINHDGVEPGYYIVKSVSGGKHDKIGIVGDKLDSLIFNELDAEIGDMFSPKTAAERKAKERKEKRKQGLTEIPRIGWVRLVDVPKIKEFANDLSESRESD